jgi:hypothetical protein
MREILSSEVLIMAAAGTTATIKIGEGGNLNDKRLCTQKLVADWGDRIEKLVSAEHV